MMNGIPMNRPSIGSTSSFRVVGVLVVLELGSGILSGYFSPLLRGIGSEYGVTDASLNWVSAMFMLGTVACVPVLAKLGDMFGHKRLLTVAIAMVALGALVVAFAPTYEVFLLGRALQAPLAAFLPLEFAIVRERDPDSAGKSIGLLVGALTLGAAVGSLVSGLLYGAAADLSTVLLVPAVFIAICFFVVLLWVPETKTRKRGRIDWLGASLLTVGMLLALTGIANTGEWGWTDVRTLTSVVLGLALIVAWTFVERRVKDPMVDLAMLTRGGLGLPIVASVLFGAQTYGSQTASFLWLLNDPGSVGFGLGLSPGLAAVFIVAYALSAFAGTVLGDRLSRRLTARRATALASLVAAVTFVLMIVFSGSAPLFVTSFLLGGVSAGVLLAVLPTIVVANAPADSVGIASGLFNTARTAAGAAAGAVFALVMSLFTISLIRDGTATVQSTPMSFFAVWGVCLFICLALAAISLRFRVREPEGLATPTEPMSESSKLGSLDPS